MTESINFPTQWIDRLAQLGESADDPWEEVVAVVREASAVEFVFAHGGVAHKNDFHELRQALRVLREAVESV